MKKVVAIKRVRYNGTLRVPNTESESFDARPADARVLVALRKVRYATPEERQPDAGDWPPMDETPKVATKALNVQPPHAAGTLDTEGYMRRDMTSESMENKEAHGKQIPSARQPDVKEPTLHAPAAASHAKEAPGKEVPKGRSKYIKEDVERELAKEKAAKSKTVE